MKKEKSKEEKRVEKEEYIGLRGVNGSWMGWVKEGLSWVSKLKDGWIEREWEWVEWIVRVVG